MPPPNCNALLADAGGVDELASTHEAISAHHGNNYAPLMERYYRSHRPVLFELLDAIELEATSTDHSVLNAVEFLVANRHRGGEYIPDHQDGQPVVISEKSPLYAIYAGQQGSPEVTLER